MWNELLSVFQKPPDEENFRLDQFSWKLIYKNFNLYKFKVRFILQSFLLNVLPTRKHYFKLLAACLNCCKIQTQTKSQSKNLIFHQYVNSKKK